LQMFAVAWSARITHENAERIKIFRGFLTEWIRRPAF